MRLGTLQLSSGWRQEDAEAVILRFRELENAITNLQMTPHSHISAYDGSGMTLLLSPSNTAVPLTGASQDHGAGLIHDDTLSGSTNKVTCLTPGHYYIDYSISFSVDAPTKHVEVGVMKNGTFDTASSAHFDFQTAAIEVAIGSSVYVELRRGDYIEIGARCIDSTTTITYETFNSSIFRVHL